MDLQKMVSCFVLQRFVLNHRYVDVYVGCFLGLLWRCFWRSFIWSRTHELRSTIASILQSMGMLSGIVSIVFSYLQYDCFEMLEFLHHLLKDVALEVRIPMLVNPSITAILRAFIFSWSTLMFV